MFLLNVSCSGFSLVCCAYCALRVASCSASQLRAKLLEKRAITCHRQQATTLNLLVSQPRIALHKVVQTNCLWHRVWQAISRAIPFFQEQRDYCLRAFFQEATHSKGLLACAQATSCKCCLCFASRDAKQKPTLAFCKPSNTFAKHAYHVLCVLNKGWDCAHLLLPFIALLIAS